MALGRDDAATAGTRAAWKLQPRGCYPLPGLLGWLWSIHVCHCHVDQKRTQPTAKDQGLALGQLHPTTLSEKPMARPHIFASLGVFEDGPQSQMRRSFTQYLELARGRPFGQVLHYNSWYDLRNPSCSDATCFSHAMTERSIP